MERKNKLLLIALIMVIAVGILLRLSLVHFGGLYESDAYLYESVITQTIANNGIIPTHLAYSGFAPNLNPYSESAGLIYIAVIPYYLLLGQVSVYNIMLAMPIVFAVFGIIGVFLLTRYLTKNNNKVALLASLMYAVLPVAVERTSALQWRGESFVPIMILWVFILWAYINQQKSLKKILGLSVLGLASLYIIYATWIASTYVYAIVVVYGIMSLTLLFTKSLTKAMIVGIAALTIGWLLVPYIYPSFYTYYFTSNPVFLATLEYAPPTPVTIFVLYGLSVLLAPLGLIAYTRFVDRTQLTDTVFLGLVATAMVSVLLTSMHIRWFAITPIPIAILSAVGIYWLWNFFEIRKQKIVGAAICSVLIFGVLIMSTNIILGIVPVGGVTQMNTTMSWIRNNTGTNATFLTSWDAGSVIEGSAQRQSYTDSVEAGQNFTRINAFNRFLFADTGNYTYLKEVKPDYLLLFRSWLNETYALEEEANAPSVYNTTLSDTNLYNLIDNSSNLIQGSDIQLNKVYASNISVIWHMNYT